jgi:hypothetical protein
MDIKIGTDREAVRDRAKTIRSTPDIIVYSDTSGRDSYLGAVVVALDDNLEITES